VVWRGENPTTPGSLRSTHFIFSRSSGACSQTVKTLPDYPGASWIQKESPVSRTGHHFHLRGKIIGIINIMINRVSKALAKSRKTINGCDKTIDWWRQAKLWRLNVTIISLIPLIPSIYLHILYLINPLHIPTQPTSH